MISFIFLLLLSFFLIGGLFMKLLRLSLSKKLNIVICIILPFLTVLMFVAMLVECNIRRGVEIKNLDKITDIVTKTLLYNKVFESNIEKRQSIETLLQCRERLAEIAFQDTLITIICGSSDKMTERIIQTKQAVNSQITRIGRLNDYLDLPYSIDSIEILDKIHFHEPIITKLNTLNLIYSFPNNRDSILATQVMVSVNDTVVFSRQYEYKKVNSITIPHVHDNAEIVKVGYVTFEKNKYIFKYNIYGRE